MVYYAHTDPRFPGNQPEAFDVEWQLLKDHLLGVAELAKKLATEANPQNPEFAQTAWWAGLLHDLGKYKDEFQQYLRGKIKSGPETWHAHYGAGYERSKNRYDLIFSILGHHAGLKNTQNIKNKLTPDVLEKVIELWGRAKSEMEQEITISSFPERKELNKNEPDKIWNYELQTRMLFSCLVDADRLDTRAFEQKQCEITQPLVANVLFAKLITYIGNKVANAPEGKVKQCRQLILNQCLQAAEYPERLLSLTVPTGGGKTLSSMAFALKRAKLKPQEVRRIIVVIPFLSIIEQNAKVYAEALGAEWILEHHSGKIMESKQEQQNESEEVDINSYERDIRLAAENWDVPIVITTSVRFFESLFSNKPSDLRRIHNIARSIVILDEVQTMPKQYLEPLLSVMKDLSEDWLTTFLFCTATQPAFEQESNSTFDRVDVRWKPGTIRPIIEKEIEAQLFHDLQRVQNPVWPKNDDKVSWEELAKQLCKENQVLCIVNVKRHAKDLYDQVLAHVEKHNISTENVYHLSTRMCPVHRLLIINQVKQHLKDSIPCIVISTQLIEAGVDLDFPVVYRAMAPLDSLAQAAGRCDREGILTHKQEEPAGRFIIFEPEDQGSPYEDAVDITRNLASQHDLSIYNQEHLKQYFNNLYQGELDAESIQGLRRQFNFIDVRKAFKWIDSKTTNVLIAYNNEANELIEQLAKTRFFDKKILRQLQNCSVGLYPYELTKAKEFGTIVELWSDSDIWVCQKSCYRDDVGVVIKRPDISVFVN